ncbi:outer envelope pore protein 16-3, chloroplastic/mitochondrial [Senna tora]|uniref:Outer envelope pore protein 16-3, chloroplastic/mitochondrial n=1 Tax=Senna tora TaxID=362788 RepID=A0A834TB67_9FABA|nr:outer envelope pore protein 16-3, chloroplastic/mitochondrial [Senna tora]
MAEDKLTLRVEKWITMPRIAASRFRRSTKTNHSSRLQKDMDPAEDEDTLTMKTIKGATTAFVAGSIWGGIVSTWYNVPRVERPGFVRTLKMMGNYGMTCAAMRGVYIGVKQSVLKYRMKRDFVNGAVGGFVAGATVLGRSISTAISAGTALAITSSVIDIFDMGKDPYTTKKKPSADS